MKCDVHRSWCRAPMFVKSTSLEFYFEFLVIKSSSNNQGHGFPVPGLLRWTHSLSLQTCLMCEIYKGNSPLSVETRFNTDCIDTDVECKRFLRDVKSYLVSWYTHLSVTIDSHVLGALSYVHYLVNARTMAWNRTLLRIIHMRPHWVETLTIRELWIL